jgi:hypothetical protein
MELAGDMRYELEDPGLIYRRALGTDFLDHLV